MGKIEHRKEIKKRRELKQKITQETSGKLIEENHNGKDYTPEYTEKVISWRFFELWMKTNKYKNSFEDLWNWFGRLREIFQTLLLHWPDSLQRGDEFWFIYDLLNYYRNGEKEKLILELQKKFITSKS